MPRQFPPRFKVAFSFAGKQREIVSAIATEVEKRLGENSVFYDEWYEAAIAGIGGHLELADIYSKRSEMVVVCLSAEYGSSEWPCLELDVILGFFMKLRASGQKQDRLRLLPVRVGDGDVPGIPDTTIFVDARTRTAEKSAKLIVERWEMCNQGATPNSPATATALLTPPVEALSAVAEQVEDWLTEQKIAVVRIDPTQADDATRRALIRAAVAAAGVVVDWIQTPANPWDVKFENVAEEIRGAAALAGKPVLRWMAPELPASPKDCQDSRTRRLPLETFKKEVLRELVNPAPVIASGGEKPKTSRLIIAACGMDSDALDEVLSALPESRPYDARTDELHRAPDFGQTPDWDEQVKDALRRKGVNVAIFIDGACQSSWIDQRLRAFDIYQEEIPGITLYVWDRSLGVAKPPRRFRPPYCKRVQSAKAKDLIDLLPP